jgi:hypothetical protein
MTRIDSDGEMILETLDELRFFAGATSCSKCRAEALLMLATLSAGSSGSVFPISLVFATTCDHE